MKTIIVCQFGYMESTKLTSLVCTHPTGFETNEAAIKDLAGELLAKYKEKVARSHIFGTCCKEFKQVESNRFCAKCGSSLKNEFDIGAFKEWIEHLVCEDYDSYGYDEVAGERDLLWSVGESPMNLVGTDPSEIVSIDDSGVEHLLQVLEMN